MLVYELYKRKNTTFASGSWVYVAASKKNKFAECKECMKNGG